LIWCAYAGSERGHRRGSHEYAKAMTLNGDPPNKKNLRDVIALATEKFLDDGGMITRERGRKVMIVCRLCRSRRYVSLQFALHFKPRCKCGAEAKIQL
jgi:hypothetical protein